MDSDNFRLEVWEAKSCPLLRFTYQVVPAGSPDSVKLTVYTTSENETVLEIFAHLTVKEPDDGEGSKALPEALTV